MLLGLFSFPTVGFEAFFLMFIYIQQWTEATATLLSIIYIKPLLGSSASSLATVNDSFSAKGCDKMFTASVRVRNAPEFSSDRPGVFFSRRTATSLEGDVWTPADSHEAADTPREDSAATHRPPTRGGRAAALLATRSSHCEKLLAYVTHMLCWVTSPSNPGSWKS